MQYEEKGGKVLKRRDGINTRRTAQKMALPPLLPADCDHFDVIGFINRVRLQMGYTQRDLAFISGVKLDTIRKMEQGYVKSPTFNHVEKMLWAMNVRMILSVSMGGLKSDIRFNVRPQKGGGEITDLLDVFGIMSPRERSLWDAGSLDYTKDATSEESAEEEDNLFDLDKW